MDEARQTLIQDVALVSSGTIATLTGIKSYASLDKIHHELINFAADHYQSSWRNWRQAWQAYQEWKGIAS